MNFAHFYCSLFKIYMHLESDDGKCRGNEGTFHAVVYFNTSLKGTNFMISSRIHLQESRSIIRHF